MPIPVILILGPTAGGKTRLSIELAQRLGGECIGCDSMQVYRGMDIGTAKPTDAEQAAVPHHLLNVADPTNDSFSVDRWLELADKAIAEIRRRDHYPIIVGGTNLYVQAFLYGLADMPAPDAALRDHLNRLSPEELRAWLAKVDPQAAERIHPNDRKRTIRAIEVFEQTGQRLSEMQTQWDQRSGSSCRPTDVFIVGLDFSVEAINRRINARVKAMVEAGFVDELRGLLQSGKLGRNAREALGYKQIFDYLEGRTSLEDAMEQVKVRTRRFAKQQRTWLKRFRMHPTSIWIAADDLDAQAIVNQVLTALQSRMKNCSQHVET